MEIRVFISYRRGSTNYPAAILHHFLSTRLGTGNVFLDRESLPHGVSFMEWIGDAIGQCSCVIALIGPDWAPRLDDPKDFVRQELEIALAENVPILPVFVEGIDLVPAGLPSSLSRLSALNGARLRASLADQSDFEAIHQALASFAAARLRETSPPARRESFDRNSQLAADDLLRKARELESAREFDEALKYFELAAQKGSVWACHELTEIYSNGETRDQDLQQMARWSLRGAELGDTEMMGAIGTFYATGMGVDLDFEKARYWLRLGASSGDKTSRELLDMLESPLVRFQWKIQSKLKIFEWGLKQTLRNR